MRGGFGFGGNGTILYFAIIVCAEHLITVGVREWRRSCWSGPCPFAKSVAVHFVWHFLAGTDQQGFLFHSVCERRRDRRDVPL